MNLNEIARSTVKTLVFASASQVAATAYVSFVPLPNSRKGQIAYNAGALATGFAVRAATDAVTDVCFDLVQKAIKSI